VLRAGIPSMGRGCRLEVGAAVLKAIALSLRWRCCARGEDTVLKSGLPFLSHRCRAQGRSTSYEPGLPSWG
jgi:hypothetical protein